jgi:hypothetical protein
LKSHFAGGFVRNSRLFFSVTLNALEARKSRKHVRPLLACSVIQLFCSRRTSSIKAGAFVQLIFRNGWVWVRVIKAGNLISRSIAFFASDESEIDRLTLGENIFD